MATKTIKAQMKQRTDTAAAWAANNPVLLKGEMGFVADDDTYFKVGDGSRAWNELPKRLLTGMTSEQLAKIGRDIADAQSQAVKDANTYTDTKFSQLDINIFVIPSDGVLPETGKEGKIYLIPSDGGEGNLYDEYLYNGAWEKIGALNFVVDQSLNPESTNAISNKAVAEAIASAITKTLNTEV